MKTIVIAALAVIMLTACNKEEPEVVIPEPPTMEEQLLGDWYRDSISFYVFSTTASWTEVDNSEYRCELGRDTLPNESTVNYWENHTLSRIDLATVTDDSLILDSSHRYGIYLSGNELILTEETSTRVTYEFFRRP
jgi:hypothetical protein